MVLKAFIHYLIDKYLKNYFERFDYEKVKLSLKSGSYIRLSFVLVTHSIFIQRKYRLGESSIET